MPSVSGSTPTARGRAARRGDGPLDAGHDVHRGSPSGTRTGAWRPGSPPPSPSSSPDVTEGAEVVALTVTDRASTPAVFVEPSPARVVGGGLGAGLLVALLVAVARDRRTETVESATDVENAAIAPLLAHLTAPADLTSMPALRPGSAEADMFRHLRLALEAETSGGPVEEGRRRRGQRRRGRRLARCQRGHRARQRRPPGAARRRPDGRAVRPAQPARAGHPRAVRRAEGRRPRQAR